jgi:hypothetical protein
MFTLSGVWVTERNQRYLRFRCGRWPSRAIRVPPGRQRLRRELEMVQPAGGDHAGTPQQPDAGVSRSAKERRRRIRVVIDW